MVVSFAKPHQMTLRPGKPLDLKPAKPPSLAIMIQAS